MFFIVVLKDLIIHTPENHPDYPILQKALKLSEENLRMYNVNPTVAGDNKVCNNRSRRFHVSYHPDTGFWMQDEWKLCHL